jgi:probable rRNA maturation factor
MTVAIELANRSGVAVEGAAAEELARSVLAAEGIEEGELGITFVGPEEIRRLKQKHLGINEETDVLSFPLDGRDDVPDGVPRQLGDAVLCAQVVGSEWREPLVHGLLHLLGYEHGPEMEERERSYGGWA